MLLAKIHFSWFPKWTGPCETLLSLCQQPQLFSAASYSSSPRSDCRRSSVRLASPVCTHKDDLKLLACLLDLAVGFHQDSSEASARGTLKNKSGTLQRGATPVSQTLALGVARQEGDPDLLLVKVTHTGSLPRQSQHAALKALSPLGPPAATSGKG